MNITSSISKQIGGDISVLIDENPEIQFYANSTTNQYHWRDNRYEHTRDIWKNQTAITRQGLIHVFKKHLEQITQS
jgi:catalase